jgi:hypothetical protein
MRERWQWRGRLLFDSYLAGKVVSAPQMSILGPALPPNGIPSRWWLLLRASIAGVTRQFMVRFIGGRRGRSSRCIVTRWRSGLVLSSS